MGFTFYRQLNAMDCGPTCLRMIAKHYGKHYSATTLRRKAGFGKEGVSLLGISDTAESLGFRTRGIQLSFKQLKGAPFPCILHWGQNHFVVLLAIDNRSVKVADPAVGIIKYSATEFLDRWISADITENNDTKQVGVALLLEPTSSFYKSNDEKDNKLSWHLVINYLVQSKAQIFQVFIALIINSLLQLIFPFLAQSVVDTGINSQNMPFVIIVLVAQLTLTFSQTIVSFIRSRLLLRISNILNLQIISDFWIKLTRLPLSYFSSHQTGDTMQRLGDHGKIQNFLTGPALDTLFSVINFILYAFILAIYSSQLLFIFFSGSIIYFIWIQVFLRIRRKINYQTFHLSSRENTATLQLIQGMQEIRLNNAEKQKRWDWENIQASVFTLNFKNLNYSQWQSAGATFINQVQNIAISFVVARLVIEGSLTLGSMVAVQYIVGQLSGPIGQWVSFVQSAQDAKISMERLNEVHQLEDEEDIEKTYITNISGVRGIDLKNLSFTYPGTDNTPVLENINLHIAESKITAIVGASGSGKSTLLKILLKIYDQYNGEIRVAPTSGLDLESEFDPAEGILFGNISHSAWRQSCGSVMQDGYIFSDTIANNIAIGKPDFDMQKMIQSCRIANIYSHIESLPNGFDTMLGSQGVGLSQGQKQRILIARAVYKNPDYLLFDEATNSLDTNNEKEIVQNLNKFFIGRTVIVIAHRLSTVKNADKIVVLHKGTIVEEGTHTQLIGKRGKYFELVKNQLEVDV